VSAIKLLLSKMVGGWATGPGLLRRGWPGWPQGFALGGCLAIWLVAVPGVSIMTQGAARANAPGLTRIAPPSPAFGEIADIWLHGPESEALPGLSDLAQTGDPAAQVLLGLIDKSPALQGPWLSRLPRARRLHLMRMPEGLSGRSWLTQARGHPLADHWLALLSVDADRSTAASFSGLGEARAAREAVLMLAARERLDLDLRADETSGLDWPDWLDTELIYVLWPRSDDAMRDHLLMLVPPNHPQRALMGLPVAEADLAHWLQSSDVAAPLRAVCDAACPDTLSSCLIASYTALGSHNALLTLGSPAENLITTEDFLNSRRGRSATLRRILLSVDARGRRAQILRARQTDSCLADLLMTESDRYRYIREGSEAEDSTSRRAGTSPDADTLVGTSAD
jgi:hypothetical protein